MRRIVEVHMDAQPRPGRSDVPHSIGGAIDHRAVVVVGQHLVAAGGWPSICVTPQRLPQALPTTNLGLVTPWTTTRSKPGPRPDA